MAGKLSEDRRETIERPHVALKLTVNLQRGLAGVSVGDVPSHINQVSSDLEELFEALRTEADEVADVAEAKASELDGTSNGEIVAKHCDARKLSMDSNGSSCYLRVEMTSTRRIPQPTMALLTDALLEYFKGCVHSAIKKEAASKASMPLVHLGGVALAFTGLLGSIVRHDEPQLGDRA